MDTQAHHNKILGVCMWLCVRFPCLSARQGDPVQVYKRMCTICYLLFWNSLKNAQHIYVPADFPSSFPVLCPPQGHRLFSNHGVSRLLCPLTSPWRSHLNSENVPPAHIFPLLTPSALSSSCLCLPADC